MNRRNALGLVLGSSALAGLLGGCAPFGADMNKMETPLDGTSMANFDALGDANWRVVDGAIQGDKGNGFLVSKKSYKDFYMVVEFWSDADANSGIFIRCTNPKQVTATNSYEVNIFDKRPNQAFGTGAIVGVAEVSPMPWAAGRWNTMEITAQGPVLTVSFNGSRTVNGVRDARFASGPFALQSAGGTIKFRKVQIVEM